MKRKLICELKPLLFSHTISPATVLLSRTPPCLRVMRRLWTLSWPAYGATRAALPIQTPVRRSSRASSSSSQWDLDWTSSSRTRSPPPPASAIVATRSCPSSCEASTSTSPRSPLYACTDLLHPLITADCIIKKSIKMLIPYSYQLSCAISHSLNANMNAWWVQNQWIQLVETSQYWSLSCLPKKNNKKPHPLPAHSFRRMNIVCNVASE